MLVLLSAEVAGLDTGSVLPTACAIEYIHTYSLIHDDLPAIDNDDMRRGKPACHVAFGEDIAILAGDALFAEAFFLIASKQKARRPELVVSLMTQLAEATGVRGMVGGQAVDVVSSKKHGFVDAQTVKFIHEHKTGKLITLCAKAGAVLAGAGRELTASLEAYGQHLGLAFQITDDVLDLTGDTAVMGKPAGSDEEQSKLTFPGVFGLKAAKAMAREATEEAKRALEGIPADTSKLAEMADFVCEREK